MKNNTLNIKQEFDLILYAKFIVNIIPQFIEKIFVCKNELTIYVKKENLLSTLLFLKNNNNCLFKVLADITAVDYPEKINRFEVIYNLLSVKYNTRLYLKTYLSESEIVHSVSSIYKSAVWLEREIWDMFGIFFSEHPDLRRILTDYGFDGFPLRKDFPLTGFSEIRYDDEMKRIVYDSLELAQEFRVFDFLSPWERNL